MRTLYIDATMGAAGDMLMAALFSLLSEKEQNEFLEKINSAGIPQVRVEIADDEKCGMVGKHARVLISGIEEGAEKKDDEKNPKGIAKTGMADVERIVQSLHISENVKRKVLAVYKKIAQAESEAHGVTVSEIHFHEVGQMDAIADITGCALLLDYLQPECIVVSPVNVGYGTVKCAHGILPVPAPATVRLLEQIPCYVGETEGELCTPTGAALLSYFGNRFSKMPCMRIEKSGCGTGKKDFAVANVLRVFLGETEKQTDEVIELSCNIDDATAEEMAYATELLRREGALEVYTMPAMMKKNRMGMLLTVLCREQEKETMIKLLFRHTPTIGIRERRVQRHILDRKIEKRQCSLGEITIKTSEGYGTYRQKPEYEDLRELADKNGLSLQEVKRRIYEETDLHP